MHKSTSQRSDETNSRCLTMDTIIFNGLSFSVYEEYAELVNCIPGKMFKQLTFYNKNNKQCSAKCIDIPPYIVHENREIPVTAICKSVFDNFTDVEYIKIPSTVSKCMWCFWRCLNLKYIEVDKDNKFFCDVDGVLYSKDKKELVAYPPAYSETYNVPKQTECICHFAFKNCSLLKHLSLPDTLIAIGSNAFYRCYSLHSIIIPHNLKYFGPIIDHTGRVLTMKISYKDSCKEYDVYDITKELNKKPYGYKNL